MELLMYAVGIIGAGAFALCALPQVIKSIKNKSTTDISILFIVLSMVGNIFSTGYVLYNNLMTGVFQYPLYFNYAIALSLMIVLLVLKLRWK